MEIGKKLLGLQDEYRAAVDAGSYGPSAPRSGRHVDDIAAEYESTLKELLR